MRKESKSETWGVIALFCYATACVSAISAIATFKLSLPASDGASDIPLPLLLLDPFLLVIAVPLAIVSATISLPVAIWALRGTDLRKSIPRVALPTILCAAVTGPANFLVAAGATMLTGVVAMFWVRSSRACKLAIVPRLRARANYGGRQVSLHAPPKRNVNQDANHE